MEAIEFLDTIYGDIEGYINIVTMDPLDEEETVKSKFVEWPEKRDFAQRYLSMREDENTYCSVGVFTGKSRSGDDEGAMCNVVHICHWTPTGRPASRIRKRRCSRPGRSGPRTASTFLRLWRT